MKSAALGDSAALGVSRDISKGIEVSEYAPPPPVVQDLATRWVARRFDLPLHLAGLVAELAGLGGGDG